MEREGGGRRRFCLGAIGWLTSSIVPVMASPKSVLPYNLPGKDSQGHSSSLRSLAAGDRLVVVVMKRLDCPVCLGQLSRISLLSSTLSDLRTRWVGLVVSPPPLAGDVPLILDPDHRIVEALGLWLPKSGHPMPALLVFDRCGKEVVRRVGRSGGDRPEKDLMNALMQLEIHPETCQLGQPLM